MTWIAGGEDLYKRSAYTPWSPKVRLLPDKCAWRALQHARAACGQAVRLWTCLSFPDSWLEYRSL